MIDRKSRKPEMFWKRVERIFGEASKGGFKLKDRTKWNDVDDVIYLGAGFFRAVEIFDEEGIFEGIRLINPSLTHQELETVEAAFWLLP